MTLETLLSVLFTESLSQSQCNFFFSILTTCVFIGTIESDAFVDKGIRGEKVVNYPNDNNHRRINDKHTVALTS